jgi:hypothetical protein
MGSKLAHRVCRAVVAVFAVVGVLAAQNVTVPALLNGVEGGGGTSIPFGSNQACRIQCIYDAAELPWQGPRALTAIKLRADNNTPNTAMAAKGWLQISVLVSTTDKTALTASPVFADNRGADATWVILNQLFQLPAQPALPAGPRPANIVFPFATPWMFGLTPATSSLPPPQNLLVEFHIHSQPSGAYRLDNLGGCSSAQASFGSLGPACAVPGQPGVTVTGDPSMLAGSSYGWNVANAAPNAPYFVALDVTNQGGLFGSPAWPLPYPMFDPANPAQQSPALAALGYPAPDCWLNITPVTLLGGVADATGAGIALGAIPPGRQMLGQVFYAQAVSFAQTANPLRIITSLGRSSTVCGPLGVARVYAFYNNLANPPPPPPTSGLVQVGVGFILDVQ